MRLTRLRETTYGVLPTAAAMLQVRRTGGSGSVDNVAAQSDEVRPDLMPTDVFRTDKTAKQQIDDEWVFAAHDAELEDVFGSVYSTPLTIAGITFSAANADSSYNDSANGFVTGGIVAGAVIDVAGFTTAGNNGRCHVLTVAAGKITVSKTLTDEAAGDSVTIKGSWLRNGTTRHSVVFEEQYPDVGATELWQYTGSCCTQWQWQFDHPGKMTTSFSYECATGIYTASTAGNGTVTAYAANPVMNSADHFKVSTVLQGGAALTAKVKSLSLTLAAAKRRIGAAGYVGAVDMGMNTFALTGQIGLYNDAAARAIQVAKHKDFVVTSLEWEEQDALGNIYHKYLPAIYYSGSGAPSAGAKDSDVMITLPFTAKMGSDIASLMQITKFPIA
jgi:hypothetical protein